LLNRLESPPGHIGGHGLYIYKVDLSEIQLFLKLMQIVLQSLISLHLIEKRIMSIFPTYVYIPFIL